MKGGNRWWNFGDKSMEVVKIRNKKWNFWNVMMKSSGIFGIKLKWFGFWKYETFRIELELSELKWNFLY